MRPVRPYLMIAFVAAHLLLVAVCGIGKVGEIRPVALQSLLSVYGNYTGTDAHYGYFAPEVAPQVTATVIGREASGREHIEEHRGRGTEAELRLTAFLLGMAQMSVYDSPAASLSVEMFNRLPEIERVTVLFCRRDVPTMAEYRQGKRPTPTEIYRATFVRKGDLSPALPTSSEREERTSRQ